MSDMKSIDQRGIANALLLPLILVGVLLLGSIGFGYWAFSSRQDYKDHSDKKVAAAEAVVKDKTQKADAKQYAEEAKNPLKKYVGPSAYGNVTLKYPKTWSAYVVAGGSAPVNGYFQPDVVPDISADTSVFALRLQILQQSYDVVVQQYSSQVQQKTATSTPYSLPKVPSVIGVKIDGALSPTQQGSMVILPLRNVTVAISTQSMQYLSDFNNIILPNATFTP